MNTLVWFWQVDKWVVTNQMRPNKLSGAKIMTLDHELSLLSPCQMKPQRKKTISLCLDLSRNFASITLPSKIRLFLFFITYLTCFICASKLEIQATINKARLKAAWANLRLGLKNQTAPVFCGLHDEGSCYKENRTWRGVCFYFNQTLGIIQSVIRKLRHTEVPCPFAFGTVT